SDSKLSSLTTATGPALPFLKVTPPRVVVRYGSPLLATCSSTSDIEGVGWESSYGGTGLIKDVSSLALNISSVETWELEPQCYASLRSDGSQCLEKLPVTVYKLPKSVSLSQPSGGGGPMVEGQQYKINCYIANVAPRKNLSVNWYKGNTIFQIDRFREASLSPDDISSEISITAHRNDSGADLWCEAKLTFKSVEQNPPPMCSQSKKLNPYQEIHESILFILPKMSVCTVSYCRSVSIDAADQKSDFLPAQILFWKRESVILNC
uniref:Ig-like domain-containing protein n=1 Tax=Salarias fasciatus TaxID=181472 RepID=A0A672IYQ6_SALFA